MLIVLIKVLKKCCYEHIKDFIDNLYTIVYSSIQELNFFINDY
jgi:hypothetical protein